jgi:hypothetical protein
LIRIEQEPVRCYPFCIIPERSLGGNVAS